MALCLAYADTRKILSSLNGIDDKKSCRSGQHDSRGQTAFERALDLYLLPRSTCIRLNVNFLLLIQPYNSFELHLNLTALDSSVKVARFQLQVHFSKYVLDHIAITTRFYIECMFRRSTKL